MGWSVYNQRMDQEIRQLHHCNFEHFGDTWRKAKLRLFGHILRSSRSDPINQVVFDSGNLRPRIVLTRRVGRPISEWLLETYADAYRQIAGPIAVFDPGNDAHLQIVKQQALQRLDPFQVQMMAHQGFQPLLVIREVISSSCTWCCCF